MSVFGFKVGLSVLFFFFCVMVIFTGIMMGFSRIIMLSGSASYAASIHSVKLTPICSTK